MAYETRKHCYGVEPFEHLKSCIDSAAVYALDGKTLKVWRKSEQNGENQQFFDESFWKKREREDKGHTYHEWTYELLPENLKIKGQD